MCKFIHEYKCIHMHMYSCKFVYIYEEREKARTLRCSGYLGCLSGRGSPPATSPPPPVFVVSLYV